MMKIKNVIFIDLVGNEKSTVAGALAKDLDLVFSDSDGLIEMKFDQKISEVFRERDEAFFRQEERKVASFLYSCNGASIASGGGFIHVLDFDKIGFCVYLKASFKYLKKHLNENEIAKRPLFYDEVQTKRLYNRRLNRYEQKASLILDVEDKNIGELAIEIKEVIK